MEEGEDMYLHNLSVSLATLARDQLDLAQISLTEEDITHLGQSFSQVLKHMMEWQAEGLLKKLPIFKGYTVDERLKEFRKIEYGKTIEFIPFDSPKGQELLSEMRAEIPF